MALVLAEPKALSKQEGEVPVLWHPACGRVKNHSSIWAVQSCKGSKNDCSGLWKRPCSQEQPAKLSTDSGAMLGEQVSHTTNPRTRDNAAWVLRAGILQNNLGWARGHGDSFP